MIYTLGPRARRVYRILRDGLLSGEFAPGTQLPSHTQLAVRFGVATLTVRHVLAHLQEQQLAARLQSILRESDTVARFSGDEFGLLLPATTAVGATCAADKLLMALEQPFVLEGHCFVVEASIGFTVYSQHGGDVTTLLRRADIAMPAPAAERAADAGCGHLLRRVMR